MTKYRLFNEWRRITIIGDDLADALTRRGTLQSPDEYAVGVKTADGAVHTIARIIHVGTPPYRRGDCLVERAIVEFTDGRIAEIDAQVAEVIA
jgi:hypothetical protein